MTAFVLGLPHNSILPIAMTNWAKKARLYERAARDTTCCRCDEPIRAGEPILWLKGLKEPGQAHLGCGSDSTPQSSDP